MSLMGMNAIAGSYDQTAQNSGVPVTARHHNHQDDDIAASHPDLGPAAAAPSFRDGSITETASSATDGEKGGMGGRHHQQQQQQHAAGARNGQGNGESGDDDPMLAMQRREEAVQQLARTYSQHQASGGNPFLAQGDSPLNPASGSFSGRAWAKSIVDMVSAQGHTFRTAGVAFQDMSVYGYGEATDYQKNVWNVWHAAAGLARNFFRGRGGHRSGRRIDILRSFDGVVRRGEMLVVLGPPGSGCSTFLKTIAGETNGLYVDDASYFNYQGMTAAEMHSHHRGEAIYTAEVDVHFPQLTVGDTLTFAAWARQPRQLPAGIDRTTFAVHLRDVVMAMFGISHTINTRVGNEYVRGVSGGERKRVTIAEAALGGAPLQCWDNSTRGLDSANAVEFCRTLRLQTELFGSTACVSIYQSPQSAYDLFDKACVLYEGRQIFFGRADAARQYFVDLGFECPARQTTPDFLTSMTSSRERRVRNGFKGRVPRTPDEFALAWRESTQRKALLAELEEYRLQHPLGGPDADAFRASKRAQQARSQRAASPYTLSYVQQVRLCLWRGWRRLAGDPSLTVGALIGNFVMALIIGSVFYNLGETSDSFFQRGSLLFFACLMNAFASALEILTLYAQRPIVEKHSRYALYHPSAEAVASMLCDLPYKILNTIIFNITLYFLTNLRREPGPFFFFILVSFMTVLAMSMIFRTIASASRTLSQAMVPAAILILDLIIFTGFVIPIDYMLGWCRWLNYLDPLAYAFESLIVNEFHDRQFLCNQYVPNPAISPKYANAAPLNHVCSAVGALPGASFVDGDRYVGQSFRYSFSNRWRNFGILIAFTLFFLAVYMVAAELVSEKRSRGEVLVFRKGEGPVGSAAKNGGNSSGGSSDDEEMARVGPVVTAGGTAADGEAGNADANLLRQSAIFHWSDVCYDVKIKGENRRILDHVDGWVKPGTLTALMGVSGAGKTTLLDCLADRIPGGVGVITGEMLVDGHVRDWSFQRKTGYVQQQDLHLQTTTVREALNFSALLRQPEHVPRAEKLAYVDEVIRLLGMGEYADAVVGVPGEGLNVEQRKRLTIGVELAARPPLLLFVDEPTSGLDSQTSWSILDLLESLTKAGQAVLCTIHQPSAMLFQRFDRLLFLAKGGKTVYFGEVGEGSSTMTSYFERHAGPGAACPPDANPAEWMLEVIGAAPGSATEVDWFKAWRESDEYAAVQSELRRLRGADSSSSLRKEKGGAATATALAAGPETAAGGDKESYREFSAPFGQQLMAVTHRVFQQYWRTPSYIYSKAALCILVSLFIGFVFFRAPNSIQGLQNQMFAIFNLMTVFGQLAQQTMPHFVVQRSLYESRERPSKVYSWKVFMLSQIIVELPWNTLMAGLMFCCWYYPVGLNHNAEAAGQTVERGALMFLFLLMFMLFTSTFTDMVIAGFETAEAGGNIANLLFTLCLIFCGVLSGPDSFPRFWIFMYYVSPFTYLVSGMLSTAVANTQVVCAPNELLSFDPPAGSTCIEYAGEHIAALGGYLTHDNATAGCELCPISETNIFLKGVGSDYSHRWRNFGILLAYVAFNIVGALVLYWLARVPKGRNKGKAAEGVKKSK